MDLRQPDSQQHSRHTGALLVSLFCFVFVIVGGAFWGGNATTCFQFIGCNAGFFGYDAIEHLFSGILEAVFIVWLGRRYSKFDFYHKKDFFKNVVVIFSIVVLIGFGWEVLEFGHDHMLNRAFTFNAIGLLRPSMAQPSNSDTMGDLTFDLLGGLLGVATLKILDRDSL